MTELKPCPFCNGPAQIMANYDYKPKKYTVYCITCGAKTGVRATREKAAINWNRRVNNE